MVSPDLTPGKRNLPALGDPASSGTWQTSFWGSWNLFIKVSGLSLLECIHVGRPRDFFQSLKKNNTILANSGNLGITDEAEVQSSKENTCLCLTQFSLVLVLFFKKKKTPSSQACMVSSKSDSGFLGSLDVNVNMFQNPRQAPSLDPAEAAQRICVRSLSPSHTTPSNHPIL